jgi:hypothetical protein
MSSAETDRADRRERERFIDQALAESRRGRDRLRDRADAEVPDAHGDQPTPNVGGRS